MEEYKKQDEVLDGLMDHVVNNKSLIDQPCRDGHEEEFIDFQTVNTLDDGTEMELCLWNYGDDAFWDISIDKKRFGEHAEKDFLAYLEEKGLHLGNIEDSHGEKWKYKRYHTA
jgi:hypothetical protein